MRTLAFVLALLLGGCTATQKTVAGGVMMGVGGATAAYAGINVAALDDGERIARTAGARGTGLDRTRDTYTGFAIGGAIVFAIGTVVLITGLYQRAGEVRK